MVSIRPINNWERERKKKDYSTRKCNKAFRQMCFSRARFTSMRWRQRCIILIQSPEYLGFGSENHGWTYLCTEKSESLVRLEMCLNLRGYIVKENSLQKSLPKKEKKIEYFESETTTRFLMKILRCWDDASSIIVVVIVVLVVLVVVIVVLVVVLVVVVAVVIVVASQVERI